MMGMSWGRRAFLDLLKALAHLRHFGRGIWESSHDGQMTLLQQSNLYESMASWLQSAQKKFFGKTVVGRVLFLLVTLDVSWRCVYVQSILL